MKEYHKRKILLIHKCDIRTSSRLVYKELDTSPVTKMEFLNQADYVRYITVKLSKYVKISIKISSDCFLQRNSLQIKR